MGLSEYFTGAVNWWCRRNWAPERSSVSVCPIKYRANEDNSEQHKLLERYRKMNYFWLEQQRNATFGWLRLVEMKRTFVGLSFVPKQTLSHLLHIIKSALNVNWLPFPVVPTKWQRNLLPCVQESHRQQHNEGKMMNVNEFISSCSMESFRAKQRFRVTRQAGNKPIMTLHVSHWHELRWS
jgi:hypothetical protein